MSDQDKGRIALRFAPAPSSKKPPPRAGASSTLGKRPRPHAFGGHDSDSDDDEHHHHRGKHEIITGFGAQGAETERELREKEEAKKEFVIQRQPNRDWRAEVKGRGRNLLPEEATQRRDGHTVEREPVDQDKEIQWGLTVKENKEDENEHPTADSQLQGSSAERNHHDQQGPPPARTADEEAMDALLGRTPTAKKTIIQPPPSEDDAYRRDAAAAGAESTLDDYEAMPVEEFGAALLRGMGWNGEPRGPKPKEARRRANRLGLGAKELKESEDLGGWDQKGVKKRRPRLDEYRREESKRKESRRNEDSYKRERERDRDGYRDRDRHRDRHRGHDRDQRR